MIHPEINDALAVRVTCPCCDGHPHQYLSGPSWGYWGGQDAEYAECPECDGLGMVEQDAAEEIEARGRRFHPED